MTVATGLLTSIYSRWESPPRTFRIKTTCVSGYCGYCVIPAFRQKAIKPLDLKEEKSKAFANLVFGAEQLGARKVLQHLFEVEKVNEL